MATSSPTFSSSSSPARPDETLPPFPSPSLPPLPPVPTTTATPNNGGERSVIEEALGSLLSTSSDDDVLFSSVPLPTATVSNEQQSHPDPPPVRDGNDENQRVNLVMSPNSNDNHNNISYGGSPSHAAPHQDTNTHPPTGVTTPHDGDARGTTFSSRPSTVTPPTRQGESNHRPHAVAAISSPWQFDETVIHCSSCHSPFNWINRRHHCRLCGHIFCDRCTNHRALIPPSQIVLTPAGFQGNKRPTPLLGGAAGDGTTSAASFTPQEDPDRMLTYLAPATSSSSSESESSSSSPTAAAASLSEPPRLLSSSVDPTLTNERTILYGRGLEERMHLAREPLRVCHTCYPRLVPLQPQLIASNSNMMRYNPFDPHDFRRLFNSPIAFTLGHEIRKAAHTLHNLLPLPRRMNAFDAAPPPISYGGGDDEFTSGMFTSPNTDVPCRNLQQEACGGGTGGPVQPNLANLDGVRIPAKLLEMAKGIAVMTIIKGGLGFAGMEMGTGLVIARTRPHDPYHQSSATTTTGWTPPSAIGTIGVSWGALIGAQVTDHVFLLMDDNAVSIMFGQTSMTLGVDVGIAVGPVGRAAEADLSMTPGQRASGIYTYSLSKGLYAGISLDGKVVVTRNDVNEKFYGRRISGQELLNGHHVPTPPAAQPLYEALARCHVYASSSTSTSTSSGPQQQHPYFRRNLHQLPFPLTTNINSSASYNFQGPPPARSAHWNNVDPVMGEYGEEAAAALSDPYDPSSLTYYGSSGENKSTESRPVHPETPSPVAPSSSRTDSAPSHQSPSRSAPFQASPTIVSLPPPPAPAASATTPSSLSSSYEPNSIG